MKLAGVFCVNLRAFLIYVAGESRSEVFCQLGVHVVED